MSKFASICVAVVTVSALSSLSFADEAEDMVVGNQCMEAKKIVKMIKKTDGMKPEKTDTVKTFATMKLSPKEGGKLPERVFYRHEGAETNFELDEEGEVVNFKDLGSLSKKGELCMHDPVWIGKNKEDVRGGLNLGISFDVSFINTSGTHSMTELIDGTQDGKSHYKKMFPGPMAILVPKMTHVAVGAEMDDEDESVRIVQAIKDGTILDSLKIESFSGMQVISIEDLQALGADSLTITGGAYSLTPVPSIEKMKKFGFGSDGKEAEDEGETADKQD